MSSTAAAAAAFIRHYMGSELAYNSIKIAVYVDGHGHDHDHDDSPGGKKVKRETSVITSK